MLIALLLMLPIAAGGLSLSYLIERDEPLMWRIAAGTVIGSAIFGTLVFLFGCAFGLAVASPLAFAVALSPLTLFRSKARRKHVAIDWQRATNKLQGGSWSKIVRFSFYAFFFLLFCLFFSQAMYRTPAGIYTGASQNLGDLAFHLGAVFGFTDGGNFPPQNPSFAGAKFSYPFIADVVTAAFTKLRVDVESAVFVQDVAWAFSLFIILERLVLSLTGDRFAGKLAPWLLFFSGGLGFVWFLSDYWHQGKSIWDFLNSIQKDYTISDDFRWGNSLTTLFITQRSLLLGMPLTLIVLQKLWQWFQVGNGETPTGEKEASPKIGNSTFSQLYFSPFLVGLIAGLLPLVHLHSLAVLFVVTIFLLGLNPENWRVWIAFGVGVCLITMPELIWSATGTASNASQFVAWHFGWDKGESNIFWFWFKNTGLVLPLVVFGVYLYLARHTGELHEGLGRRKLWLFYLPFLVLFIACNAAKFAPWEWDNIKILIYWYIASIPFVAMALSWLGKKGKYLIAITAVIFASLVFSGSLDVWRTASGQIKYQVFNADSVRIADSIKAKTPQTALFLNAATFNTAVALSGRQSLMRYPGHLSSYGIDYREREADVKRMYAGGPTADALLSQYNVDYVLISQEETSSMTVNKDYFNKYPVVAESGAAKVYKIK